MVRQVLQTGVNVELAEHLGYEPYAADGRGSGNNLHGSYPKTITTEIGQVEVQMPRNRQGTFDCGQYDGERGVLGLWVGPSGGEGAKQWATMLTELRNRGLCDALIVCCDGPNGLPESIRAT